MQKSCIYWILTLIQSEAVFIDYFEHIRSLTSLPASAKHCSKYIVWCIHVKLELNHTVPDRPLSCSNVFSMSILRYKILDL